MRYVCTMGSLCHKAGEPKTVGAAFMCTQIAQKKRQMFQIHINLCLMLPGSSKSNKVQKKQS